MDTKVDMQELLAQAGLPQFELEIHGSLIRVKQPGTVVKYFRERMKYPDQNGNEIHWTQSELGQRLALSTVQVGNMENHNQGLDSIERREALITILKIPPVLLGLGTLDQLVEMTTGQNATAKQTTKRAKVGKDTIQLYRDPF